MPLPFLVLICGRPNFIIRSLFLFTCLVVESLLLSGFPLRLLLHLLPLLHLHDLLPQKRLLLLLPLNRRGEHHLINCVGAHQGLTRVESDVVNVVHISTYFVYFSITLGY